MNLQKNLNMSKNIITAKFVLVNLVGSKKMILTLPKNITKYSIKINKEKAETLRRF